LKQKGSAKKRCGPQAALRLRAILILNQPGANFNKLLSRAAFPSFQASPAEKNFFTGEKFRYNFL
jgi:hypothetical protein